MNVVLTSLKQNVLVVYTALYYNVHTLNFVYFNQLLEPPMDGNLSYTVPLTKLLRDSWSKQTVLP